MKNSKKITEEVLKLLPKKISNDISRAIDNDILFIIPEKTRYITKIYNKIQGIEDTKYWINGTTVVYDGYYFVYFSSTEYKKNKAEGCRILAHELAHVWQYIKKPDWVKRNTLSFDEYENDSVEKEAQYYGDYVKRKLTKKK